LKVWPNALSFGHASWHAEHGNPYFLANAGIARIPVNGAAWTVEPQISETKNKGAIETNSQAIHPKTPFFFA
jgi:hypothetical protein